MSYNKIDYVSIGESIVNVLVDNLPSLNTSLSANDLSTSTVLYADYQNYPLRNNQYPCIFVNLNNKSEEKDSVNLSFTQAIISYNIVGLIYYKKGASASDKEIQKFASNVEDVLRNNQYLSNTVEGLYIPKTDFIINEDDQNRQTSAFKLNLECWKYLQEE